MPRGNGTGPMGIGRQSGRGAGYCSGLPRPGYASAGSGCRYGAGYGRGFRGAGSGRGFGAGFDGMGRGRGGRVQWLQSDPPSYGRRDPETDKGVLQRQAEDLQIELDAVRKRLADVDATSSSS